MRIPTYPSEYEMFEPLHKYWNSVYTISITATLLTRNKADKHKHDINQLLSAAPMWLNSEKLEAENRTCNIVERRVVVAATVNEGQRTSSTAPIRC